MPDTLPVAQKNYTILDYITALNGEVVVSLIPRFYKKAG